MYNNSNSPYNKAQLRQPMANSSGTGGNMDVFNAVAISDNKEQQKQISQMKRESTLVDFPKHLFIPEGAGGIDIRRLVTLTPGSVKTLLMRFTAPPGCITRFISYGIFNDGQLETDYEFLPTVDGARIFPYHGDPMANYRIALGLSPDLSNNSLINCQLTLLANQVLEWYITNTSVVDTDMGVRMVGYFDATERSVTPRFGG